MPSIRPNCSQCVFWVADRRGETATTGHCHRYPPGVYINPQSGTIVQKFPSTDRQNWCGEWSGDDVQWLDAFKQATAKVAARV